VDAIFSICAAKKEILSRFFLIPKANHEHWNIQFIFVYDMDVE